MKCLIRMTKMILLVLVLCSYGTYAQDKEKKGSISGLVLGKNQKDALPGASVIIRALNIGGTTDFDGRFLVTAVPVGKHTLEISYLGFKTKTQAIEVKPGEKVNLGSILLEPSLNQLGEIVITASIEGQQKAYNQQKNSDNLKTIVSADLVNQFPDINVSEALQRVAGVNIERNNGEGSNIRIRGTPRNYTTVSIDGAQLPTTDGNDRTEALDLIPAELLSSLEISKSLLPENDGDAIGGAVNLRTPTARSKKGRLKGTLAGGYATIFDRGTVRSKLRYDKRTENDKFGIIVGGSYYNTVNGEERFDGNWRKIDQNDDGVRDLIVLNELELRPRLNLRTRIGANVTFDYKFSDNSQIFLTSSYNTLTDESERYRIRFRAFEDFPVDGNPLIVGSETGSQGRFRRDMADVEEQRENITLTFGGNHVINNSGKLDYGYSLSSSEREETSIRSVFRAEDIVYDIDLSDRDFPQFIPRNFDPTDYSQYEFSGYQTDLPRRITGINQTVFINYEQPLRLGTNIASSIKGGGKLRFQDNTRRLNNTEYSEFDGIYTMDQVLGGEQGSIFGGRYDMGRFPSPSRAARHFRENFALYGIDETATQLNTETETYDTEENIYAFYAQGKIDFGKLSGVFGVRYEGTETSYLGNQIEQRGQIEIIPVEGGLNYDFWLPSASFKYELTNRTNLRASYFESFARPNFIDLVPSEIRNFANNEVRRGNPDLIPAYARNVDVMFEHYFKKDGTFSLGLFYKSIDNFIFQQQSVIQDGSILDGFQLIESVNGDSADVRGVEVAFAKKFTFLPGWLNGFGIYANYTYVDSSSSFTGLAENEDTGELEEVTRTGVPLIGQADHTWNAAFYYDKGKFSARASLNYNSRSTLSFNSDPFFDFFLEERYQLDANASYKINDKFTIFIEAQNLTDAPVIWFNQVRDRVSQNEIYGISARMGINFNF